MNRRLRRAHAKQEKKVIHRTSVRCSKGWVSVAETQAAKIDRYIAEDRVTKVNELPDGGSIWRVNGDGGTYRVIIDDVGVDWTCSCPAGLKGHQDCVHAFAVLTVLGLEPPEPPDIIHLDTPIVDVGVFNDPANHDATEGELLEAFPEIHPVAAPVPATIRKWM